jgi:hypothetical protein
MVAIATHSGPVRIGKWELIAFNLLDGRRIIDKSSFKEILSVAPSKSGTGLLNALTKHPVLRLSASGKKLSIFSSPIEFKDTQGKLTSGYEAEALVDLCKFLLKAREIGALRTTQQLRYAQAAEDLIVSLANVGIIAIIDEATGFQKTRSHDALQSLLDKFLLKAFAAWAKRFPDEFYSEMFRLKGWKWQGRSINPPQCVASYTNQIVYQRLAPGILDELEKRNPITENGERNQRHHQWLTPDVGHPALSLHLYAVTALMKASKTWGSFLNALEAAFPRIGDQTDLGLDQF